MLFSINCCEIASIRRSNGKNRHGGVSSFLSADTNTNMIRIALKLAHPVSCAGPQRVHLLITAKIAS